MLLIVVAAGIVLCAAQAIRARHLLGAALWLAGASALCAILLYTLGAHEVAVIELSVGAGLVTVLLVFAISIAGDEPRAPRRIVPPPLAWGLAGLAMLLLGWLTWGVAGRADAETPATFAAVLWQARGLDMLVQIVLVFAGVLGVLALLTDQPEAEAQPAPAQAEAPAPSPAAPAPLPQAAVVEEGAPMTFTPLQIVLAAVVGLLGIGFYGLLAARKLIKVIVALQILVKGAILALVAAGHATGQIQLGQSLALTVIVADTVVAVVGLALAVQVKRQFGTLDVEALSELRR